MNEIRRLPAVVAQTGLAKTQIYAGIKAGTFPKQIPIGQRTVGWLATEVDAWVQARIAEREGKQ